MAKLQVVTQERLENMGVFFTIVIDGVFHGFEHK